MENLIAAMETMPTGVYTVGMMLMFLYWAFVIIGVLDVDLIPFDAPDMDAAIDLDADADADVGAHAGFLGAVAGSMGIGTVPLTVILTSLVTTGWIIGVISELFIWPIVSGIMPSVLFGILQGLVMVFLGIKVTAVCMKPLKTRLKVEEIHGQAHLIGKVVEVTSGSVSDKVGMAGLREPGLDLVLTIRAEEENDIKKGDRVVVVDYIKETNIYKIKSINLDSEGV